MMKMRLAAIQRPLITVLLSCSCCMAETRVWTLVDGRTIEGEFVIAMGSDYILKSPKGEQMKVPAQKFSEDDRLFVELSHPPELDIDFINNLKSVTFWEGYYGKYPRMPERHGNFGFWVKQVSSPTGTYRHELKAELYVFAQQIGVPDKKLFVLDRQEISFQFKDNGSREFEFMSKRQVRLERWGFSYPDSKAVERGEIYYGYLVAITDSRGEIVVIESTRIWFKENLENLRKLRVGNFFDKKCNRCFPGRPVPLRWG